MILVLDLLLICVLLIILYQDFNSRGVSWFLFPGLFGLLLWKAIKGNDWNEVALNCGLNLLLLALVFLLLTFYFSIKQRGLVNVINNFLGIGDICLWIVVTVYFSPVNFILFFLSSLVFSLILHVIVRLFKKEVLTVPLAGYQSAFMIGVVLIGYFLPLNFFLKDDWVLDFLIY